jgi:two-component system OmpR family response regulator
MLSRNTQKQITLHNLAPFADDCEIRSLVSRFLRSNDFRVSAAGNGREMDRALKDPRIDLIVLDLMLPGEDGLSLCRRLKASSDLPIIMRRPNRSNMSRRRRPRCARRCRAP